MDKFAFRTTELHSEFNRILRQQTLLAHEQLQKVTVTQVEGIHGARKCFKRLRACYRLLNPADKVTFRQGNRFFRDLSASLSPLRDSQVMRSALQSLSGGELVTADCPLFSELEALLALRELEAAERATLQAGQVADRLKRFIRQQGLAESIPFDDGMLLLGIGKTYATARRGWKQAVCSGGDDDFHYWRKHTKYYCYQIRLLAPLCPLPAGQLASLEELCTLLGDYHDLAVLKNRWVMGRPGDLPLLDAIVGRQAGLAKRGEPLARKLLWRDQGRQEKWLKRSWLKFR